MIKILEDENFEEVIKEGRWLVEFNTSWCAPCKMLDKELEKIKDKINILKVDAEQHQELAIKNGVMSVPTIILFVDGEQFRIAFGYHTKEELELIIE